MDVEKLKAQLNALDISHQKALLQGNIPLKNYLEKQMQMIQLELEIMESNRTIEKEEPNWSEADNLPSPKAKRRKVSFQGPKEKKSSNARNEPRRQLVSRIKDVWKNHFGYEPKNYPHKYLHQMKKEELQKIWESLPTECKIPIDV